MSLCLELPLVRVFILILLTGALVSGEYLGCYEDSGKRLFSDYRMFLNDINSPGKCGYICSRLGYSYAGVEYGNECFCSHQRPSEDKKKSDDDCQFTCPNSKDKCGGRWKIAVYSVDSYRQPNVVTGSDDNWTYIGCYEDSGKRLLSDFQIKFDDINTPGKCNHVCGALGFPFAGVEHGNECFCSKQKPKEDKKKDDKGCQTSCPHSKEKCGGFWRTAVYYHPFDTQADISALKMVLTAGPKRRQHKDEAVSRGYLGCFEDNRNRLLSDYKIHLDDINSPKKCLHVCRQLGYKYAGVEFGKECFCGNEKPDEGKKRRDNDCNSTCPNSSEKCGGFWRLSAYTTKQ